MPTPNEGAFVQIWPKCFVIFMGIVELLATIVLFLTELGNVAANFWYTNVFAGGWCGLLMLVHFIALFVAGCCKPGPPAAFRAVIITIIALIACAACISFNAVFIALPSTCILTPQCVSNANTTSIFSYTFQLSFYTVFNSLGPFKSYTQTQSKFLFQTIQLGVASLCFVLCIIYLIVYYVTKNKAAKQVGPSGQSSGYNAPQPDYQSSAGNAGYRQQPPPSYRQQQPPPPPRQPQANPGEVPWSTNNNRRY